MVVLQLINKIIKTADISLVVDNNLTKEMFLAYEDEFEYIENFYNEYGKVPDKETFLNQFKDFELLDVEESNKYLIDKLNEEWLYYKTVPVVQRVAELLKSNSDVAVNYLLQEIPKLVNIQNKNEGVDIIKNAEIRLNTYKEKLNGDNKKYITTGFEELDTLFKGFAKGEELVVLFARIGQRKIMGIK